MKKMIKPILALGLLSLSITGCGSFLPNTDKDAEQPKQQEENNNNEEDETIDLDNLPD